MVELLYFHQIHVNAQLQKKVMDAVVFLKIAGVSCIEPKEEEEDGQLEMMQQHEMVQRCEEGAANARMAPAAVVMAGKRARAQSM